jgi:hypothetical protein
LRLLIGELELITEVTARRFIITTIVQLTAAGVEAEEISGPDLLVVL